MAAIGGTTNGGSRTGGVVSSSVLEGADRGGTISPLVGSLKTAIGGGLLLGAINSKGRGGGSAALDCAMARPETVSSTVPASAGRERTV